MFFIVSSSFDQKISPVKESCDLLPFLFAFKIIITIDVKERIKRM